MKKILSLSTLALAGVLVFTGCNKDNKQTENTTEQYKIYQMAKEAGATDLTYEEWLVQIKGPKGDKGDTGATGPQGEKGEKGEDGATIVVPVEYSKDIARGVYFAALNNSKKQGTIELEVVYTYLNGGSIVDNRNTIKAYWRNTGDKTDVLAEWNGSSRMGTRIGEKYYNFDIETHKYFEGTGGLEKSEVINIMDSVCEGMLYDNGAYKIMFSTEDTAGNTYYTVNVQDNLIVEINGVFIDSESGILRSTVDVSYKYNNDLSEKFADLPTSLEGWTEEAQGE